MKLTLLIFSIGILLAVTGCTSANHTRQAAGKVQVVRNATSWINVAYSKDSDPRRKLDIYFPAENNKPAPVLVHIHGGGWRWGNKGRLETTGKFYASKGILFIAPNYRLSPDVKHPAHVEDCAAALAWVFENVTRLGGDKDRIYLSGFSAGAHLATLLGTNTAYLLKHGLKPNRLTGVISVDTASFNLLSETNERLVTWLVRNAFGTEKQVLKDASPFHHVSKGADGPAFLIFNTTERSIAVDDAKAFTAKLKAAEYDATFVPVENHTHKEMSRGMYNASGPVGKPILDFILNEKRK